MEEAVVIKKSSKNTDHYLNDLNNILGKSKINNQLFFLYRYPGQEIRIASHNPLSDNQLSFVSFDRSTSIVESHLDFITLSEIHNHQPIEISSKNLSDSKPIVNTTDQIKFQENVATAIEQIQSGNMKKVVLSKVKALGSTIDPIQSFFNLEAKYARALVYCIYYPGIGMWIGASPEKLLEKTGTDTYQIHSLAGTKSLSEDWTTKEVDEQRIVTDYILNRLPRNVVSDIKVDGPTDLNYGNIKHLKTSISFATKAKNAAIINVIHPTPAVCGMPVDKATTFINEQENHDRSLYTGYLGLKILSENTESYFVNLRCMQLTDDNCYIYTGAGIVADSIPSDEWKEVEAKAQTIVDCLSIHE